MSCTQRLLGWGVCLSVADQCLPVAVNWLLFGASSVAETCDSRDAGRADFHDRAHPVARHHQRQVLARQVDVRDDRRQPLRAV